jgi:hypothetical protein
MTNDKVQMRSSKFKAQMPNECQSSNVKFDIGILTFGFHWDFGFWHLGLKES